MNSDGMDYKIPELHTDPLKRNIYHVQDSDRPMWIAAVSYTEALQKWERNVARENECEPHELQAPAGIALIAEFDEVIL